MHKSVFKSVKQVFPQLAIWVVLMGWAVAACNLEASTKSDVIAFTGVNILSMTENGEKILENHTVLVQGARIVALGPSDEVEVPDEATKIDGEGPLPAARPDRDARAHSGTR